MTVFMQILGSTKESLRKILVRGEFDEYLDDSEMHCTVRMAEMLDKYTKLLQPSSDESAKDKFLMEEIAVLEETKLIGLPNFLPRTAFLTILQRKLKKISGTPIELVEEVWNYIENVVVRVVIFHSEGYLQLQNSFRRASHNLILKMRDRSVDRVKEMVEMEKLADYTCDPEYMSSWNSLMAQQDSFITAIKRVSLGYAKEFDINGYGEVEIGHLKDYLLIAEQLST
ncbi:hypothetical protein IFM89_035714 [Coptis chinensis]|uniref:Dynamin stalk domain-containing protein n=1 Tax=Coptis chinensis TaxID=261450 RepID=A0A835H1K2_9MAGN|nr:hypothetical protein IFM89_035714 [Coptis chinensis]